MENKLCINVFPNYKLNDYCASLLGNFIITIGLNEQSKEDFEEMFDNFLQIYKSHILFRTNNGDDIYINNIYDKCTMCNSHLIKYVDSNNVEVASKTILLDNNFKQHLKCKCKKNPTNKRLFTMGKLNFDVIKLDSMGSEITVKFYLKDDIVFSIPEIKLSKECKVENDIVVFSSHLESYKLICMIWNNDSIKMILTGHL